MSRTLLSCILICICLFSCRIWEERGKPEHPSWLKGEWLGVGLSLNAPQSWTMELIVDGKNYNIRYPTLDCSGVWTLKRATSSRAEFLEVITYGHNRCINGGKVVITRVDKNHVSYSYFATPNGTVQAHSTLINSKFKNSMEI